MFSSSFLTSKEMNNRIKNGESCKFIEFSWKMYVGTYVCNLYANYIPQFKRHIVFNHHLHNQKYPFIQIETQLNYTYIRKRNDYSVCLQSEYYIKAYSKNSSRDFRLCRNAGNVLVDTIPTLIYKDSELQKGLHLYRSLYHI